ncbi:hypothetical protein L228DRAFT_236735 [Xylona heveae TC161]|uniref:RING-type domain-containing protein n=1 Tax=Xylona heveae (strain CBS 132557 / TC161) TaxID=1328760 RepID=A0A165J312_XYLHT|nr:hypothetical protein L228DRAFT_236735 [Xylona heveae TC161]KZF25661.1 hypothetical protein L228DRAFT_236735 [Xylona heveae TC161]
MATTAPGKSLGLSAVGILFSCGFCQASISDVYSRAEDSDGLRGGTALPGASTAKFWLAECTHLICGAHLDGGGVPFYAAGSHPKAPCPICRNERGITTPLRLYWVHGISPGQYDPEIPQEYFVVPPQHVTGSEPALSAMRFQYLSLIRYGTKVLEKLSTSEYQKIEFQKLLTAEANTNQELRQEIQKLKSYAENLETRATELESWKTREAELKHFVKILDPLTRENEMMRQQLIILGLETPKTDYKLDHSLNPSAGHAATQVQGKILQNALPGGDQADDVASATPKDLHSGAHNASFQEDTATTPVKLAAPDYTPSHADSEDAGVPLKTENLSAKRRRPSNETLDPDAPKPTRKLLSRDLMPPPPLPGSSRITGLMQQTTNQANNVSSAIARQGHNPSNASYPAARTGLLAASPEMNLQNLSLKPSSTEFRGGKPDAPQRQSQFQENFPASRYNETLSESASRGSSLFQEQQTGNANREDVTQPLPGLLQAMYHETSFIRPTVQSGEHGAKTAPQRAYPIQNYFPVQRYSTGSPLATNNLAPPPFAGGISEADLRNDPFVSPLRHEIPVQRFSTPASGRYANTRLSDTLSTPSISGGRGYEGRRYTNPRHLDTSSVASPFFKTTFPPNDLPSILERRNKNAGTRLHKSSFFENEASESRLNPPPRKESLTFRHKPFRSRGGDIIDALLEKERKKNLAHTYPTSDNIPSISNRFPFADTSRGILGGDGRIRSDISNFWQENDKDMPPPIPETSTRGRTSLYNALMNPPVRKVFSDDRAASMTADTLPDFLKYPPRTTSSRFEGRGLSAFHRTSYYPSRQSTSHMGRQDQSQGQSQGHRPLSSFLRQGTLNDSSSSPPQRRYFPQGRRSVQR